MKAEIRNHFKRLRMDLDKDNCQLLSKQAQELFLSSALYKAAENIMVYLPLKGETDTQKIISQCFFDNKQVLIPVTDKDTLEITPVIYTQATTLKKGTFSIFEPENPKVFDKSKIDLVLVPGIAFSAKGSRIGFGKGCYDRLLKGMTAKKVGFCYDFQLSNLIKSESHDSPMDYIITEKIILNCSHYKNNMPANYHTHTYFCHHAIDTPREYVETAIHNGLEILGFSDHNPCPFSNGFTSDYRIDLDDAKNYVDLIKQLKEEFKYKIKILLGYETEYYPAEYENTMKFIKQYDCDYMILGQHFTKNGYDGEYSGSYKANENTLMCYVDQVIEGINTGVFSYIAHPDLINYRKDNDIYDREMTRLLIKAKELSIPVEFNLLGFEEERSYPYDHFWELVKEIGNDVIVGCDAHKSEACGNPEIYQKALEKLLTFGITPIPYLKLKEV